MQNQREPPERFPDPEMVNDAADQAMIRITHQR
jgi:hypothetical protein